MTANRITLAACIAVAGIALGVFGGLEISKSNARAARIAAEPWRQGPGWKGTKLNSKVASPPTVIAAFEKDPPAPDGRRTES